MMNHGVRTRLTLLVQQVAFFAVIAYANLLAGPFVRADDQRAPSFEREVRPILSTYCYTCHGPDESKREAELRLDLEDSAAEAVAAGNPDESELLRRIESADPDEIMPPPDTKRVLTDEQKSILRRWVQAGAPWAEHWAYKPIVRPQPPASASRPEAGVFVRNPIDQFVQNALGERGMEPNSEASRRTLIRRLSLDLTGLPPTIEEVIAYLNDKQPGAYERLVKRLLNSPEFGERMAWDWLDAARYADSNGYQGDRERTMWPWRDWVVKAYNDNLPFDEFTVWQLAGDLLEKPTYEQTLATGFCRNHMINGEGGRIPEENRVDYVMDMTETMGAVWLAATYNCCRCHDHKYDPVTQREYYQLFSFFNQTPVTGAGGNPQTPPVVSAKTETQRRVLDKLASQIIAAESTIETRKRVLRESVDAWSKGWLNRTRTSQWRVLQPKEMAAEHQTLRRLDDDSVLAEGPRAVRDNYTLTLAASEPMEIAAIRLQALRHESLTKNSLSRADSGNFVLTNITFSLQASDAKLTPLKIESAEATFEQGALKIAAALDSDPKSGWAVYEGRVVDREHAALFRLPKPIALAQGSKLIVRLEHQSPHQHHNLGRFRFSASKDKKAPLTSTDDQLLADLQTPKASRTKQQEERIEQSRFAEDPEYQRARKSIEDDKRQRDAILKGLPKVMVMADAPNRRETFVLDRGLYNKPGDPVDANTPNYLPQLPVEASRNRLALANWLVGPEHPLTARVAANRIWQQFFGVGLVKTAEDFGVQGEPPMHPELLDWLAATFREGDWNVKELIRLIVTSHTYRQSSDGDAAKWEADPGNRWLARGARFRMPSWMLRDQALAASGLLVKRMGGPPVNGYQPGGVWEEATFGKKKYRRDSGDALYRRSLYTFWRRIIAPTMFFDTASRQACSVNVKRTNTPLHALTTLNDITFVEAARTLAQHALDLPANDEAARLDFVFQRVLARNASEAERRVLLDGLRRTKKEFERTPDQAKALLEVGESPRDADKPSALHASWTALCLAVFNLDEALTRE